MLNGDARIGVIFPRQGSQFVGMGHDLYDAHASVREMFETASRELGFDLAQVCFYGPEQELAQTRVTQPAIFVHSVAVFSLLRQRGLEPWIAAGHSLGEYSALVAAGYLDFEEGVSLVGLRGRLMQEAGEKAPGTMAAIIGLEYPDVKRLCLQSSEVVVPANVNAPGQVVISGSFAGVDQVIESSKAAGARMAKKLNVSGAFHSPLMEYATGPMRERLSLAQINKARIAVVANVTANAEEDPETIRDLLVRQITSPVLWSDSITDMAGRGVRKLVECGPGNVLAGLCRRIDKALEITSIGTLEQLDSYGQQSV